MKKEKKEKKEKAEKLDIDNINLKELVLSVKLFSIVGVVLGFIFLILTGYYFVVSTDNIINYSPAEIQNDRLTINYMSNLNDYSREEAIEALSNIGNKTLFIVTNVALPTLILVIVIVLIIISCKIAYDIVKNVKENKNLFTNKKLEMVKKLRTTLIVALLISFLAFGFSLISILFIELALEIIIYLFENCVERENKS